jgi:hypothetical protein
MMARARAGAPAHPHDPRAPEESGGSVGTTADHTVRRRAAERSRDVACPEERHPGRSRARRRCAVAAVLLAWAATRALLLMSVFKVVTVPGPDVTADVSVTYSGWYMVLHSGIFPWHDVTWQYPPAAALALLSPGLLHPFLGYAPAFFVLACAADAFTFGMLLRVGGRPGGRRRGAWGWVAGVALLGPTVYARYDLMVTAVAVAALLALTRHPRTAGALAAFGAMLKVWPALLLIGVRRGRETRRAWVSAVLAGVAILGLFAVTMPGALAFLRFQGGRGTEVESLGSLVFHVARHCGWHGAVMLHYGSMEFLGPYVHLVSDAALTLTVLAFGWLVLWRLRAAVWSAATAADAALTAVLLFTTTSRVISPQYMIWLVGLAAVCLSLRVSRQLVPSLLALAATGVTFLEFPLWFAHVVASDWQGILLLTARNGLLVAACVTACLGLWRSTRKQPPPRCSGGPSQVSSPRTYARHRCVNSARSTPSCSRSARSSPALASPPRAVPFSLPSLFPLASLFPTRR